MRLRGPARSSAPTGRAGRALEPRPPHFPRQNAGRASRSLIPQRHGDPAAQGRARRETDELGEGQVLSSQAAEAGRPAPGASSLRLPGAARRTPRSGPRPPPAAPGVRVRGRPSRPHSPDPATLNGGHAPQLWPRTVALGVRRGHPGGHPPAGLQGSAVSPAGRARTLQARPSSPRRLEVKPGLGGRCEGACVRQRSRSARWEM